MGIENYNDLGAFKSLFDLAGTGQASYLTLDATLGKWDLDAGIGKTYGADADNVILKFVVGVPI